MRPLAPGRVLATVRAMSDLCLNLVTRQQVPFGVEPLALIWSLEHWVNTLDRVCGLRCLEESAIRQRFILHFDAGRSEPDCVEVERHRFDNLIRVTHRVPPPGIHSLSADWWTEAEHPGVLFACRRMLLDENAYSPAMARNMFGVLRENIERLMERRSCDNK